MMVRHHHKTATVTPSAIASTTATAILSPLRRKKGRPSLHDLQKRKLSEQQQSRNNIDDPPTVNPNSLSRRIRSCRRTSNVPAQFLLGSDSDSDSDSPISPHSYSGSDSERLVKKLRPNKPPQDEKGLKGTGTHSDNEARIQADVADASASAAAAAAAAAASASTSATALPERKLLLLVLDKLQKKDTRGVFAEPVDREELPDYHEVIENPKDFGTVRSNLDRGHYKTLEQFEDDVYLISSNAMQYNPPSTIFFRQARSIQELAKKEFETLRQDAGLPDPAPKPRRGRPPGSRNLKKLLESSSVDNSVAESPPDITPTPLHREDDAMKSFSYNLRKGPSLYRSPRKLDNCFDFSVSSSRYVSTKYGKKPCGSEDNRRETYLPSLFDLGQDSSAAFGGSERQLSAVGLSFDHSYARSLARFAGDLGPVVWGIVSKKLRCVLPPNVDFGPGWVEEHKALSTQLSPLADKSAQSSPQLHDSFNSKSQSPLTRGSTNSTFGPKFSAAPSENFSVAGEMSYNGEWSSLNGTDGVMTSGPSFKSQLSSVFHAGVNSFSLGLGSDGLTRPTSSSFFSPSQSPHAHAMVPNNFHSPPLDCHGMMNPETDMGAQGTPYWKNLPMQDQWDRVFPSELNGSFQASGSRNSSLPIGSPPQLDLVLQL